MDLVGKPAPDFELKANDDKTYKLSDFKGQRVLLLFYPLDFSPVCSKELSCMADDLSRFNAANVQVFGVSVDSVWAHKAFAEARGITFPLLADFHPKGAVASRFGLYYEDKGVTHRAAVLVGENGNVERVWHYEIHELPDLEPILKAVC